MSDSKLSKPEIREVVPPAAIPGGEFQIRGIDFAGGARPRVLFGDVTAPIIVGSDQLIVARVPDLAPQGPLFVENGSERSQPWTCEVGVQVADSLHPVANPAVDPAGNVYTTFSGTRGQKTPVSVYRIDPHFNAKPFLSDIMNATAVAVDRDGLIYVSSRYDGVVYQVTPRGEMSLYVEGMGIATGIVFDPDENLYVGDRSGTIFKIARNRQIYVFATVEPSIAAYHLTFGVDGYLYVTGPTTSSFDSVHRISPAGEVETFYRGLGRPQGMAFDANGNLYVAASLGGRRGVVRVTPDREAQLFLSGPNIVGLAFAPPTYMYVTTTSALFRVDAGVRGLPLPIESR
ncbi:MAG: gluconolaconase [Bryobacterales bacterium]|nr:gluconolaconase [Bryobacterales bacterium]